ncbi:phospholipase A and acyltransferase 3-like isoform X1 [Xyrichtys novacula]|uniref:Phospholipase A and acyltransferase 3-like isoform X1 n=1 Tax=Xyrichtys novacula TaxID=13765 RepID=A0AAV1GN10_XYRNO|nr:phospholipase A and acyltransferase 3-like isoform X1 [Xyrichtys novacula]
MDQRMCKHDAEPGDLIEIFRVAYQHWGVYIGDDKIVHFSPKGDDDNGGEIALMDGPGEVKCEDIWDVIGRSKFKVNNQLDDEYESHTPKTIVEEALDMVRKELQYSLTGFNCEHFATYLRYGVAVSRQVDQAAQNAADLAAALLSLAKTVLSPNTE